MPQYCCVPNCKNSKGGHTFPKNLILRKRWIVAIKRNDQQTENYGNPGSTIVFVKIILPMTTTQVHFSENEKD
ncbi:hypothetical protein SNE40_018158 [Patella caerulea]|uniref:THAP-type domain-containing protein n=1 Tax=Patella caerulea TaxID=87958 RepID=A0AAN8PJG7_PATCE